MRRERLQLRATGVASYQISGRGRGDGGGGGGDFGRAGLIPHGGAGSGFGRTARAPVPVRPSAPRSVPRPRPRPDNPSTGMRTSVMNKPLGPMGASSSSGLLGCRRVAFLHCFKIKKRCIVAAMYCTSIATIATCCLKLRSPVGDQVNGESHEVKFLLPPPKVESGWDDRGMALYNSTRDQLPKWGTRNITFWHCRHRGTFVVSNNTCNNECHDRNFWEDATRGGWERGTFDIFEKYVNENETTVVDFGTWIGPTMIHHGSFSRRSIGIEADPVAYAFAEYNIDLNRAHKSWGDSKVTVDSGCVARPEDEGLMEMKAGLNPGQSMSGISEKIAYDHISNVKWFVECYTLPTLFEKYWRIEKPYRDVMIKIDIESYECKLVPSFYDWLKDEEYLPKMFISFHPQIQHCTVEDYEGVLKFLRLYDHVLFHNKAEFEKLRDATGEEFQTLIGEMNSVVIYQNHHAENFPNAKL